MGPLQCCLYFLRVVFERRFCLEKKTTREGLFGKSPKLIGLYFGGVFLTHEGDYTFFLGLHYLPDVRDFTTIHEDLL